VFADLLAQRLSKIAQLTSGQLTALETHYQMLLRWNRKMNLTSIAGLEESIERHYCESLFLAASLPAGPLRIADIGSGAGFPGLPIAVYRPNCRVALIESHRRKSVFLREVSRTIPNVTVLAERAEDVTVGFDWAVSRAVSYEDLGPFLKNMAPNAGLLTGADTPPEDLGFVWDVPVALPWGDHRFLRTGHPR
jgi:16S rRNA (guanine(527)-N(7))-methyltransferase RsmG